MRQESKRSTRTMSFNEIGGPGRSGEDGQMGMRLKFVAWNISFLLFSVALPLPVSADHGPTITITQDRTLTANFNGHIVIGRNNIILDCAGHTVTGFGLGLDIGIHLVGRTGVTVTNCHITNFHSGIRLVGGSGNTLLDNVASDNVFGIHLEFSTENETTGNTLMRNRRGIVGLSGVDNNLIASNTISESTIGIGLQSSNNSIIQANIISFNEIGVKIGFSQCRDGQLDFQCDEARTPFGGFGGGDGNTLSGNTILNNDVGVKLEDSDNNDVIESTVSDNSLEGILLLRSDSNEIRTNEVNENGVGIKLIESDTNKVRFNTLQGNARCILEIDSVGNKFVQNQCDP